MEPHQAEMTWGSRVVRRLDALTAYETVAIVERDAGRADAYGIPQ